MNCYNLFDSVVRSAELGFKCIELGAAHRHEKKQWKTLTKIAELYPDNYFTIHGLFPPLKEPEWFNVSLGLTDHNKEIIDNMFKAAGIVNAHIVSFHPGFLHKLSWGKSHYGMNFPTIGAKIPRDVAMKGLEDVIQYSLEKAKKAKVIFAIENVDKSNTTPLLQRKKDFEKVFKKFPKVQLLFDYGHAVTDKTVKEFLQFGEKICEVHLHAPFDDIQHYVVTERDLHNIAKIPNIKKIPVVLEHNNSVNVDEMLFELDMVQSFLNTLK